MPETIKLTVPIEIDLGRVTDLIIGAIEGEINYWCGWIELFDPKGRNRSYSYKTVKWIIPDGWTLTFKVNPEGGDPRGGEVFTVDFGDREKLVHYIKRFSEIVPQHFSDWLSGNDDATTADVFIQVCCFDEVVYG